MNSTRWDRSTASLKMSGPGTSKIRSYSCGWKTWLLKEHLNKKNSPGFLFPALFNTGHNHIEILIKPLFALFLIIPAPDLPYPGIIG